MLKVNIIVLTQKIMMFSAPIYSVITGSGLTYNILYEASGFVL